MPSWSDDIIEKSVHVIERQAASKGSELAIWIEHDSQDAFVYIYMRLLNGYIQFSELRSRLLAPKIIHSAKHTAWALQAYYEAHPECAVKEMIEFMKTYIRKQSRGLEDFLRSHDIPC